MWILILIGKILLWILLALIILLLLVLFFPIQYRIRAAKTDTEIYIKGKVSWLFGFLRVIFDFPKSKEIKIWVLFVQLNKKRNKKILVSKHKTNEKHTSKNKKEENNGVNLSLLEDNNSQANETNASFVSQDSSHIEPENINASNTSEEIAGEKVAQESSEEKKKQNIFQKVQALIEKIQYTIKSLYDKIIHIREEYDFYKALWDEPVTRGFITDSLFRVLKVLKKLLPQRVSVNVRVGTGSCDSTGYMMAGYGILTSVMSKKYCIYLEPDFEDKLIEGNAFVKGHITVFHIIVCLLQLLLDKRLRELNKKIKKHKAENKHVHKGTGTE